MSWVAVAVGGSAVIGGASSYLGGKSSSKAAKEGSEAQLQLGRENLQFQKEQASKSRSDFAPWRQMGQEAMTNLWTKFQAGDFNAPQLDAESLAQDPGYQFRLQQGQQALERGGAARGNLLSGAQLKGAQQFGQGLASQEYSNVYNRQVGDQTRQFNMLQGLSGQGQAAAGRQAGVTGQLAQAGGNILSGMGNAAAQGAYGQGQAQAGMYGGMAQSANQGIQNWLLQKNLSAGGGGYANLGQRTL